MKKIYIKDEDMAKFYATYGMAVRITIPIIYPLYKFNNFVKDIAGIFLNSRIEFVILAILIFGTSYYVVEKNIDKISKSLNKSKYNYGRDTIFWIFLMVIINIFLFVY